MKHSDDLINFGDDREAEVYWPVRELVEGKKRTGVDVINEEEMGKANKRNEKWKIFLVR